MNNLKKYCFDKTLTQYDLEALSGVPRWAIQLTELGIRKLSKEQKEALSKALGEDEKLIFPNKSEDEKQNG